MATADVASFGTGKGRITGTLESIGEDGIIGWQSPYAKEPLKLRLDKLEQLEFSTTPGDKKPAPIQITLSNGDIIPVQRISGLEEAELSRCHGGAVHGSPNGDSNGLGPCSTAY